MFIIQTLGNREVRLDYDEVEKLTHPTADLIFLRNGAVNIKHITTIVPDEARMAMVLKMPGETKDDVDRRIKEDKSEDLFSAFRGMSASINLLEDGIK